MGVFLRILFTVILIFYAFSMIIKLIFKWKLKRLQNQMENSIQKEAPSTNNEARKTHVDSIIGEYTEFEEIE